MSGAELVTLLLFIVIILYWLNGMRVKELACQHGKRYCNEHNLTFLDDTVVLTRVFPWKNRHGQLKLYRKYQFEFSSFAAQDKRYQGTIEILGQSLLKINIPPYLNYDN